MYEPKKVSDVSKLFNSINAKWLVSRSKYDDRAMYMYDSPAVWLLQKPS